MDAQILSWVVFIPLVGVPIILLLPKEKPALVKGTALGVAAVDFLVSLYLPANFNSANPGMQFVATIPWIDSFAIYYRLGLDGISLFLVLLTTLLSMLAIFSTFSAINE